MSVCDHTAVASLLFICEAELGVRGCREILSTVKFGLDGSGNEG